MYHIYSVPYNTMYAIIFFNLSYTPRISPIYACHAINTHHTNLINNFQLEPHEQCLTFWVGQKTFLVFFTQGTNIHFIVSFVCLQVWKATVRPQDWSAVNHCLNKEASFKSSSVSRVWMRYKLKPKRDRWFTFKGA